MCPKLANTLFFREIDMYQPLLTFFSNSAMSVAEVPFFGKRIDLIFSSLHLLSFQAVEAKMRDWRSAFKQAAINQLGVQRSYVAVPAPLAQRLFDKEKELFVKYDVGLISVNHTASVLLPAKRNTSFSLCHYRVLKNTLGKAKSSRPNKIGVVANAIAKREKALVLLQAGSD